MLKRWRNHSHDNEGSKHNDRVRRLLVDQGYTQLAQLNEAYATALYDRLLTIHVQLREISNTLQAGAPRWSGEFKEHLKTRFDTISVAKPDGVSTVLLGVAQALPADPGGFRAAMDALLGHRLRLAALTCLAANGTFALIDALVCVRLTGVRSVTVSMKPHSGKKRGGAVGNTA